MTNPKALAVTERTALTNTLFENPELMAMTAICELLNGLPDDDARLRVMRWAFGRFSTEFKREAPAIAPVRAASVVPVQPVAAAQAPPPPAVAASGNEDFERQISELDDLFEPDQRPAYVDAF